MKLIIGLGNPGEKYKNNRHNVGFQVVDRLRTTDYSQTQWEEDKKFQAVVCRPKTVDIIFAKPQTFMNDSGRAVGKIVNWYKIEPNDIYVIHDDLDIPLGGYKIQRGKGPRLHYGVQSIEKALGTEDFWRVRVGVDNRKVPQVARVARVSPIRQAQGKQVSKVWRTPGEQYVLQDFTEDEQEVVEEVIDKIVTEVKPITNNQ